MHALTTRQASAAAARGAIAHRRAAAPASSCAPVAAAPRRRLSSILVFASERHGSSSSGHHGHGHGHGGSSGPTPPNAPAQPSRRGVSTKEPPPATQPMPGSAAPAPSLFGMLSSLWPAGGAAAKQAEELERQARAVKVRVLESRLELEAELEACEAPGAPPLVVVASTSWCGPCKLQIEDLEEAAAKRGGLSALRIVKIDVEQKEGGLADVASELGVSKLPTLLFCGGKGKGSAAVRTTGLLRRKTLDDILDNRMSFLGTDLSKAVNY
jgi:thiol-disulfide isomerase/thioredoxin